MRVIYTDQSFESLEESIQFLLKVQKDDFISHISY